MKQELFLGILALVIDGASAFAHGKKHHEPNVTKDLEMIRDDRPEKINGAYLTQVKPIFQRSCFDCHSLSPRLPWYYKVPFAHSLMESDMKEAKEHLDLTNDFPFAGHGSPLEDLLAIRDVIEKRTMPPFRYKVMHWGSGLDETEAKTILAWINASEKILTEKVP